MTTMLGFIHKRVQGTCHPVLVKDLPFVSDRSYTFHAKTLESHFNQVRAYRGLYNTSLWSYILIYNRLPRGLIEQQSVKSFQSKLTHIAKVRAQGNDPTWRQAFQSCEDVLRHCHNIAIWFVPSCQEVVAMEWVYCHSAWPADFS